MPVAVEQLVEQIHTSPNRIVLAVTGGGSRAIADLLEVPGASRTLLEAVVPYSEKALRAWLGGRPDQFCSPQAARAMAMVAFRRALGYEEAEGAPAGIACTAGLATDRIKRGSHRAYLSLQTVTRTATWSLELQKDRRTRAEEERLVGRLVLNLLAAACNLLDRLELDLFEGEQVEQSETVAPQSWQDLLLGKVESVCAGRMSTAAILSGAFNPLHGGHRHMLQLGEALLGTPVAAEISIINVDKPPLDYYEIQRRTGQFPPQQILWLTRAATFEEKSRLFPGAVFLVGVDTLRRIAAPSYYADDSSACQAALERIADRGCRFLVFGRHTGAGFVRLADLDLPEMLQTICNEVPAEAFREDISSTELRKAGVW
jgi:nicotinamide mononucleotide (NMN) deamidase PncC